MSCTPLAARRSPSTVSVKRTWLASAFSAGSVFIRISSRWRNAWKRARSRVRIAAAPSFAPPLESRGMVIDLVPVCVARWGILSLAITESPPNGPFEPDDFCRISTSVGAK